MDGRGSSVASSSTSLKSTWRGHCFQVIRRAAWVDVFLRGGRLANDSFQSTAGASHRLHTVDPRRFFILIRPEKPNRRHEREPEEQPQEDFQTALYVACLLSPSHRLTTI